MGPSEAVTTYTGLIKWTIWLADILVWGLPPEAKHHWLHKMKDVIKPGTDLQKVLDGFSRWILFDNKYGVCHLTKIPSHQYAIWKAGKILDNPEKYEFQDRMALINHVVVCKNGNDSKHFAVQAPGFIVMGNVGWAAEAQRLAAGKRAEEYRRAQIDKFIELLKAG